MQTSDFPVLITQHALKTMKGSMGSTPIGNTWIFSSEPPVSLTEKLSFSKEVTYLFAIQTLLVFLCSSRSLRCKVR